MLSSAKGMLYVVSRYHLRRNTRLPACRVRDTLYLLHSSIFLRAVCIHTSSIQVRLQMHKIVTYRSQKILVFPCDCRGYYSSYRPSFQSHVYRCYTHAIHPLSLSVRLYFDPYTVHGLFIRAECFPLLLHWVLHLFSFIAERSLERRAAVLVFEALSRGLFSGLWIGALGKISRWIKQVSATRARWCYFLRAIFFYFHNFYFFLLTKLHWEIITWLVL